MGPEQREALERMLWLEQHKRAPLALDDLPDAVVQELSAAWLVTLSPIAGVITLRAKGRQAARKIQAEWDRERAAEQAPPAVEQMSLF